MKRTLSVLLLCALAILAALASVLLVVRVFAATSSLSIFVTPPPAADAYRYEEGEKRWSLGSLSLVPGWRADRSIVAVMIENHEDARPHHVGLSDALMIMEFLVEGQISRFAAIFDVQDFPRVVGPVRSLRLYFIDALLPVVRTILHAGGSPEALDRVYGDPTITAFNALASDHSFERDTDIPAPHNLFLPREGMQELLEDRPVAVPWPPYALGGTQTGATANEVAITFYNRQHNIAYSYGAITGSYTRVNGDVESDAHPHNVLVLEMPIESIGEYGRLVIPVHGEGRALLFRSGIVITGLWKKTDAESPFVFEDTEGHSLPFANGQTWMTVLPTLERVTWE